MTDNEIRDKGAKAISEMMKVNTTLTKLCLKSEEEKRRGIEKEKKEKKNE